MKKVILLIFSIFLIGIGIIFVKADDVPTISASSVVVKNKTIGEVNGIYAVDYDTFTFNFNTDAYDENYCVYVNILELSNKAKVICNYDEVTSVEMTNKLYNTSTLQYGFIRKEDALNVATMGFREWLNLQKYNDGKIYLTNTKKTYLKFKNITDSNGNIVNKDNDIYELEKDGQYNLNLSVINRQEDRTYNYSLSYDDYTYEHSKHYSGNILINQDTVSIPLSFEELDELGLKLVLYYNIYEMYENASYNLVEDNVNIKLKTDEIKYFDVDFKYKDYNEKVDVAYYAYFTMDSRYYNEDHPFIIDITPRNYNTESTNIKISFYKEEYVECDDPNGCPNIKTTLYEKTVSANTNETNHVEINDFVPKHYLDGTDGYYYVVIENDDYRLKYDYEYLFGKIDTFVFLDSKPYSLPVLLGDGGANYSLLGYSMKGFEGTYSYVIFKSSKFSEESQYKIRIVREKEIWEYNEQTDEYDVIDRPKSLDFETIVSGSLLNSKFFYLPINTSGIETVSLYVSDLDDNILYHREVHSDRQDERVNLIYLSENKNILSKSVKDSDKLYIKEGTNNVTLNVEAGHEYDENTTYHYLIMFNEQTLEYGLISGKDINDGPTYNLDISNHDVVYYDAWYDITYEILEDENFSTVSFEIVNEEEFNEIKNGEFFDFDENELKSMSKRVTYNTVLFVDLDGNDVTKDASYKVEYYKDDKLSDTQTIDEKINYFANDITVNKNKINTKDKYAGYKYQTSNIPNTIENNGTIKIYYVKDNISYSIEYYYDNVKDNSLTYTGKALYGTVISGGVENKSKDGYVYSKTEGLPLTITENAANNVIKVYYVKQEPTPSETNTTTPDQPAVLETPKATISANNNSIVVTVEKQSGSTGYQVYKSTDNKKWSKAIDVKENVYTDTGLIYGKTYYYKVKACNPGMCTSFSNTVSLKVKPNKVENLKVSSVGEKSIKVSWDKVNVTGYEVYMGKKKVATIKKNGTLSYNKKKLKANKTYTFKVRAYKTVKGKKVYGDFSNTITVKTAPTKPKATVSLNEYNVLNVKIKGVGGAVKYEVVRSTSKKGTYTKVGEIASGTYTDGNLTTGTTYYYKVRVCNSNNHCGPYSSIVSKKVVPKTPGVSVISPETKKVAVTITAVNGVDGYEVYRSTKKKSGYKKQGEVTDLTNLVFENGTKVKKTYYYKVRAYKLVNGKKVYSSYSGVKKIKSK